MSAASAAEGGPKAFQLVVAATKQFGIGRNGSLPWKLPGDMAYFKQITTKTVDPSKQNAVIMGRKTWESIPPKFRPLKNRLNIVLTRQQLDENSSRSANGSNRSTSESNVVKCSSLSSAMSLLTGTEHKDCLENIFVIGGGQVYREAIEAPECAVIHLTVVESDFDCDTFFPEIDPKRFALWSAAAPQSDNDMRYHFLCYTARNIDGPPQLPTGIASQHEEQQYLDLVADIIKTGAKRGDRTGTGTLSKFGCQMKFNLRHSFPLLTTKRVFWRGELQASCPPSNKVWQRNCYGSLVAAHLPRSYKTKTSTYGMATAPETTWTASASLTGKSGIWGQSTASSGGTLGQSTRACMQTTQAKGLTSLLRCEDHEHFPNNHN
ncbi:hypothetical protein ABBQ32_000413 [Trebouxia sp. C0010 RCD-2024]